MNTHVSIAKLVAFASMFGVISSSPSAFAMEETTDNLQTTHTATERVTERIAQADIAQDTGDIIDIASSSENFSTLVTAVQAAGLVDSLKGEGPYTLFAPTNDAFDALPDGVLDALLMPENRDLLTEVLTYHVVPGELLSSDLSTGSVETLSGENISVTAEPNMVMVNNVDVIGTDVPASNGVIHVVDEVLVPLEVSSELDSRLMADEDAMSDEETAAQQDTTVQQDTTAQREPATVQQDSVQQDSVQQDSVQQGSTTEPIRGLW